jgi:hypothetical protein
LLPLLPVLPSTPAAAPGAVDTLLCTFQLNAIMGAAELPLLPLWCRGKARISLQVLCMRAALASWGVMVATAAPKGVLMVTCKRQTST